MSFFKNLLPLLLICVAAWSCHDDTREKQLAAREQAVLKKEKELAFKEADYLSLLRMRDSLRTTKDTVIIQSWPGDMSGIWNSKSICRESNCTEYVIGDQRSNIWEFVSDSTGLFTRVTDNQNNLLRVYTARFDSTGTRLRFTSDSSATKNVNIDVNLTPLAGGIVKGIQTIRIDNACTAKFTVELTRSANR